ncbi:hypothetical protein LPUS_03952 [Lasallia pustulata]|uniref:PD-(D/E)XK nuclease-like domain-containing protein n=1 Tax=Lasallia pustulata TaxID=136370 RepID=A0A1W5CVZ6_9LECA|nr:hypothetical protein LPUS_03952 [Lasallia pustulata]
MAQFQSDKSSLALSDCSGSMIFSNRPKLVPTAPSSRSRASSPTRKQIASLENAVPPVRIRPAGEVNTFQPAKDLHNYIHREFGLAVIPSCLKTYLNQADPARFSRINSYSFDDSFTDLTPEKEELWYTVDKIYKEAKKCHVRQKDENAWMLVAWDVLRLGMKEARALKLEINSVQSQTIDPRFLPKFDSTPSTKKADLAFAFTPDNEEVDSLYQDFRTAYPMLDLSHLTDAYTGRLLVNYALEVKVSDGHKDEACLQLAIFHAAVLQKLKSFLGLTTESVDLSQIPPMMGWTMVGQEWRCFITSFATDGSIVTEGPLDEINVSTTSHVAIFRLIDHIKRACERLEQSLWPLLKPLIRELIDAS